MTMAGNGDPDAQAGCAIHLYAANRSMVDRYFYNADGEMLIVPQQGRVALRHRARPDRGRAAGDRRDPARRALPGRAAGRRGARLCLRELRRPVPPARSRADRLQRPGQPARFPDAGRGVRGPRRQRSNWSPSSWAICGRAEIDHSPLDVVAWHGNYAPYKYDLRRFNTIGSISFDHPDPSIFLVLTSPSATRPASTTSTSSSSRRAGWSPRTPSARPGSTATSRASSWA